MTAERPAAQHCADLLRGGPGTGEFMPRLELACERLTRTLAAALGRFAGGDAPLVSCAPPREATMLELAATIAPLAANSLLGAGSKAAPLLASLEAGVVLRLVDRAFGGRGEVPSPLPRAFPMSAELLIERLEAIVAGALVAAFGLDGSGGGGSGAIRALHRDGSLAQVTPFAPHEPLTLVVLTIAEAGAGPWTLTLAFPAGTTSALLDGGGAAGAPFTTRITRRAPDAAAAPFAELPLTLSAVLVDMRLPFARISALKPGDVLPVAVARSVPLRVGERTIAHGTIGALDDRVAVQLTHAFS